MHRLLILLLACFFVGTPALLRAQVPQEIQYLPFDLHKIQPSTQNPDMMCGNAGTFTFGQFLGSSNDVAPPPIFLCFGDSLLVQHNGDADLTGDPNLATAAGVAFAFYDCPPTIMGPTLQDIAEIPGPGDPCILQGSATGLYITQAVPNGGATWFFNSGALQTTFNAGQPLSLFFAPITVDDFTANNYESTQVGFPPGPCVNVNTGAAFEVVYLNAITADGIETAFGGDCLGRFTIRGGYPQYDGNALYTITISLASDPTVKALIHTSTTAFFHQASIVFSAPQAGLYDVVVEDGKSCPYSFQIDMSVCNPTDNLTLTLPETIVPPGGTICVPMSVENFDIFSGQISLAWDETVLQFDTIINYNPAIEPAIDNVILNTITASAGEIGIIIADDDGNTISIPDGQTLFEVCFTAIGTLGECTGLNITNVPTGIAWENDMGEPIALLVDTGQVCIAFQPLVLTYAVIDTTCLGQATLVVTPMGGVPGYEVTVNQLPSGPTYNGTTNTSFTVPSPVGNTNNTPLSYTICIEDNNGNGATQCTTITVNILRLGAQINFAQQPLCNGDSTGVINAVVLQGGVIVPNPGPQYSYLWSNGATGPILNGIPAGLYTVTVTDATTMCSEVASGSLGQPAPLSSDMVTITPAACSGVCDGVITYLAEGGTPFPGGGYGWAWLNETTNTPAGAGGPNNPIVLNNACGGEYRITLLDANGCTVVDSNIVVDNLRELSITENSLAGVSCNGGSNGAISVTVTESVPTANTYTFFWIPNAGTVGGVSPTSTISNLPAGTYSVLAVDALGCQIADTFLIGQPELLVLDTFGTIINPICAQPNSGSICVAAFGGTGILTYSYAWNIAGTTNCQSGLPPGDYTVTVTDANGCLDSLQFNLPVPAPPDIDLDNTVTMLVRCGGDGALSVTSPTGVLFVWTDINGVLIDSTATIDSLDGGDYIVRVFDSGGCEAVDTFTLAGVIPMSFSDTTLIQPTCFGFTDGQIAIGVQDGQIPYTSYQWDPPQTPSQSVIFNLGAGTYAVTVTDNVGCTLVGVFQLGEPPEIIIQFDPTVTGRVSCFEIIPCDGEATPLVAYSTGPGDFDFLWEDGGTDSVRVDLCAGFNSVTVTDIAGCFSIDSVEIETPDEITFSALTTTETLCFGDSTGSASILATGGNGAPYTYIWNTGDTTTTINGVPAGVYTVTLTDVDGCTNSIDTINIGEPEEIVLTIDNVQTQNPKCFGEAQGSVGVLASGGVVPFSFVWEDEDMINVGSGQVEDQLFSGTYFVTATDANGCTAIQNVTIQDPPPVQGLFEPVTPLTCFGDETILMIDTIFGGSGGPYKFSVDFGAVLDPNFPVTIGGGQHFITYYDGQDCTIEDSVTVQEPAPITVAFNPNVIEVELGATADLEPIITGAAVIDTFIWTNPAFLLNPDTLNATAYTFTNLTYTLTVVDSFGCFGVGSVTVNIDPNRNVYVPNIFAPGNNTGLNENFNVNTGLGVEIVNFMRVYDRWGELMYEREKFLPDNDNFSDGWDGRFKGDFVNPGVFVYIIEVRFLDGRVLLYRGDVTVAR